MRGGEAVLKVLMDLYPDASVYTNVYNAKGVAELFADRSPPATTWINTLPLASRIYPLYLGLMPGALEQLDMNNHDLIVSSESGPAKWVIPGPNARHICYVHSPMRYIWDQRLEYRKKVPWIARGCFDYFTAKLRYADTLSTMRVDDFVANSTFVAARIQRYYKRSAQVIHPPVDVDDFGSPLSPEDYYLFAGQLVSYKKVEVAVEACLRLKRRLVVVGDGPMAAYVSGLSDRGVDYRGRVGRAELVELMRKCRALLFPGVEDFGIVPVEVLAAGRPVVAFGEGGVMDSIADGQTGILYKDPDVEGLVRGIQAFEEWEGSFDPAVAQNHAAGFSPRAFREKWQASFGDIKRVAR
jgi:glycosyltransferase involved in cell wall biosynthesis